MRLLMVSIGKLISMIGREVLICHMFADLIRLHNLLDLLRVMLESFHIV